MSEQKEYIEKDAAIAAANILNIYRAITPEDAVTVVVRRINNTPPADVKPVVRGEWVHGEEVCNRWSGEAVAIRYYKDWHCSECGYIAAKTTINEPTYCFCPNCGAEMRRGK